MGGGPRRNRQRPTSGLGALRATWARDRACSAVPAGRYRRERISASAKKSEQRRLKAVSRKVGPPLLSPLLDFLGRADRHAKVGHQAVGQRIDPAVDTEVLGMRPGLLHDDVRRDISHLPDDIKLAQTVEAGTWIHDCIKLVTVLTRDFADRM